MKKSLSILEWQKIAEKGNAPPVRIQLSGSSMYPLVRMNQDYVTIAPLQGKLIPGDIVLFSNSLKERFVVHRIWEIKDEQVMTWGDNCSVPDGWFPLGVILGKVVLIERGKKIIHPDPRKGMKLAKFWHKIRPLFYFLWRIKQSIVHKIKKLKV
ncbi:MAG: hypothetical protein K6A68_08935 [Clostridiales bacterium]|nr:hypothetical protein [Clostridiales bacterium]